MEEGIVETFGKDVLEVDIPLDALDCADKFSFEEICGLGAMPHLSQPVPFCVASPTSLAALPSSLHRHLRKRLQCRLRLPFLCLAPFLYTYFQKAWWDAPIRQASRPNQHIVGSQLMTSGASTDGQQAAARGAPPDQKTAHHRNKLNAARRI